jgi:putative two-component system response regulator
MKRRRILIVDDQRSDLALLKSMLAEYDLIEAEDGRAALKKVAEEKPDLILLDVMMPGVDGYSVLSILKNSEKTWLIPVILISSMNGQEDKIKFLEKGADEFISKPVNPMELRAKIKNLLRITYLQDELENVHNMLVSVVVAVESKHPHLANHSRRTSFYAEKLAQKVYSTSSDREHLRLAGLLHDIGKIAVIESVFLQPGELETEDFELVKTHPVVGERICSSMSALRPILPYIRHHHEHFDGSGYPDGLKEKNIPLGARILAIADAFDALTSPRPYREAYSQEKASEILAGGAGKQWDPLLVDMFLKMVEDDKTLIAELSLRDFEQQYMFK